MELADKESSKENGQLNFQVDFVGGGRNTLVFSVLQYSHVYWFSLFRVPMTILVSLRRLFFRFFWRGLHENVKFHLADWESLSLSKYWGGRGFNHLGLFNLSLCAKSLSRGLSKIRLWGDIINSKYMNRLPLLAWL